MKIRNCEGVTLLEILVASLVFIVPLVALTSSMISALYLVDVAKDQTVGISDLRSVMERVRATPFHSMLSSFPDSVVDGPVANNYQTIVGGYNLEDEHITVNYANVNSDPLEVKISLSWEDRRRHTHSISMSTFKTR